jgi:hypothetical protein
LVKNHSLPVNFFEPLIGEEEEEKRGKEILSLKHGKSYAKTILKISCRKELE